jgi:hypothetical protein
MSYTGYSDIEAEIVTRLAPLAGAQFDVVQQAQNEAEFQKPFVNGRVTVAYNSSKSDKPQSTGYISQHEVANFEIVVQCRKLRDNQATMNGAHQIMEFIKKRLIGFQPSRSSKMWHVETAWGERNAEDALFAYSMVFATTLVVVEDYEEEDGELLTQITINYQTTNDTNEIPDPNNVVTP